MVWIDFLIYIFGDSETFIAMCPLRVAVDITKEGIVKIEHQRINWNVCGASHLSAVSEKRKLDREQCDYPSKSQSREWNNALF